MSLKMKELEARTGVSREAIRFYIREGLLPEPEKPKRNVALYTEEHVERTRLIKELQDKHFLPLKMVKAVLDSPDGKALASNDQVQGISHFLPALLRDTTPGPDRHIDDVSASSGLSVSDIRELEKIEAVSVSAEGMIDFRDAAILDTWGQAIAAGFSVDKGYNATYFVNYVTSMKELARKEVEHFLGNLGNELDGKTAAELGAEGIEIANQILSLLRTKFVVAEINAQTREP